MFEFEKARKSRLNETCDWILKQPFYRSWKSGRTIMDPDCSLSSSMDVRNVTQLKRGTTSDSMKDPVPKILWLEGIKEHLNCER